jgi:hypothetical protein
MEPEQVADIIFSVDNNIRYVGMIDPSPGHEVSLSRMREGVNSLTPEHKDREFIRATPETILGMCKSQERDLGNIRYSLLCFHRLTLMFFRTQGYVVVMSLEAGTFARPIFDRITHLLSLDR